MKKLIAFFGLLSISLTTVSALAQNPQVEAAVSRKALASLIKHSRSVKLVGDIRNDDKQKQKVTDILAAFVLTSSDTVEITNTCAVAADGEQQILNCSLKRNFEIAEQTLQYSVKIQITDGGITVLGLHNRQVKLITGT